jgi:hypothetical protein
LILASVAVPALSVAAFAKGGPPQLPPVDPLAVKDDPALAVRWVYDDLEKGFARSRKSGKPLIIVFR